MAHTRRQCMRGEVLPKLTVAAVCSCRSRSRSTSSRVLLLYSHATHGSSNTHSPQPTAAACLGIHSCYPPVSFLALRTGHCVTPEIGALSGYLYLAMPTLRCNRTTNNIYNVRSHCEKQATATVWHTNILPFQYPFAGHLQCIHPMIAIHAG